MSQRGARPRRRVGPPRSAAPALSRALAPDSGSRTQRLRFQQLLPSERLRALSGSRPQGSRPQPRFSRTQPRFSRTQPGFSRTQPGFSRTQPGFSRTQPGFSRPTPALALDSGSRSQQLLPSERLRALSGSALRARALSRVSRALSRVSRARQRLSRSTAAPALSGSRSSAALSRHSAALAFRAAFALGGTPGTQRGSRPQSGFRPQRDSRHSAALALSGALALRGPVGTLDAARRSWARSPSARSPSARSPSARSRPRLMARVLNSLSNVRGPSGVEGGRNWRRSPSFDSGHPCFMVPEWIIRATSHRRGAAGAERWALFGW
jgi:hypothetical protein